MTLRSNVDAWFSKTPKMHAVRRVKKTLKARFFFKISENKLQKQNAQRLYKLDMKLEIGGCLNSAFIALLSFIFYFVALCTRRAGFSPSFSFSPDPPPAERKTGKGKVEKMEKVKVKEQELSDKGKEYDFSDKLD